MERISIVGSSGAGKSTLARALGERLGLPVVHIDAIYWSAGWTEPADKEAFRERLRHAALGERWIIEGNFSNFFDVRLPRSDTIILLERNRWLCLWRVIRRSLTWFGRTRPDLAEGCPEKIDFGFYKWVLDFPERSAPKTREAISAMGAKAQVVVLSSDAEVDLFLASLP